MKTIAPIAAWMLAALAAPALAGSGDDAPRHWSVPLAGVTFDEEETPRPGPEGFEDWRIRRARQPYAVLDGAGEVYLDRAEERRGRGPRWTSRTEALGDLRIAAQIPAGEPASGTLFLPIGRPDPPLGWDAPPYTRHHFRLPDPTGPAGPEAARAGFVRARYHHYRELSGRDLPGAAWFRHRARIAFLELGEGEMLPEQDARPLGGRPWQNDFERSYDLFTGGRALSENLKLDTIFDASRTDDRTVPVDEIEGISVAPFDWSELVGGLDPELDPLAAFVPADQHALFFAGFDDFVAFTDEIENTGLALVGAARPVAEHTPVQARYEQQLCAELDALARLVGPQTVRAVAVTGSDPYLPTGTDLTLLFDASQPQLLARALRARQDEVAAAEDLERIESERDGWRLSAVVSRDRRRSSWLAVQDDVIVLSNSSRAIDAVVATRAGRRAALAGEDEYRFFRDRYPRGHPDETAFLVLTDATIRRWCGPRWRIGASRRLMARAALAEEQAAWLSAGRPDDLRTWGDAIADVRDLRLERLPSGPRSERYGTLDHQTPILELEIDRVTPTEAEAYRAFRDRYQRGWRAAFDPIAASLSVGPNGLGLDLTVMPLITGSDYNEFREVTGDAALEPRAGDPHAGALVHFAMALDKESRAFQQLESAMSMFQAELESPLAWVGDSWSWWVDDAPIWDELGRDASRTSEELEERLNEIPLVARVDSVNPLRLAAFLTALRGFSDGAAPGLLEWQTKSAGDDRYVEIRADSVQDGLAIWYAALPDAWVVSLNEEALLATLARRKNPELAGFWSGAAGGDGAAEVPEWLGRSVALRLSGRFRAALMALYGRDYQREARLGSWSVLPILNEWRALEPDRDPLELHAAVWGTELACPAGGEYVWNEEWQTYESTVMGHPADPRGRADWPLVVQSALSADLGLTFEHDGLRARIAVDR